MDNFSRIDTVPQIAVRDINGRLLTILEKLIYLGYWNTVGNIRSSLP